MNFPSQIFFSDVNHCYRAAILKKSFLWVFPPYMVAATYCYYEKTCRKMHTAIVLHLLRKESKLKCTVFIRRRTGAQLLMINKISTYLCAKDEIEKSKKQKMSPGLLSTQ